MAGLAQVHGRHTLHHGFDLRSLCLSAGGRLLFVGVVLLVLACVGLVFGALSA